MTKAGNVTIRYRGTLHHIGLRHADEGWPVAMLVDDRDIEIVGLDRSPSFNRTSNGSVHAARLRGAGLLGYRSTDGGCGGFRSRRPSVT
jgi:hypothetical protein